jgi:hypothetical protein
MSEWVRETIKSTNSGKRAIIIKDLEIIDEVGENNEEEG